MDLGFDTVGNATLVVYDNGPLLATDPWLGGSAYFGSWSLSHAVPEEQKQAILSAPFIWFSHGHPDHLNGGCLPQFLRRVILLPDHVGGRIDDDLRRAGATTRILPNAKWVPLTDRVRVWCFADVNQDAVLLVDIDGTLLVNINDATQTGWGPAVNREVRRFSRSVLLQLSGFGDADMINFVDEDGQRVPPLPQLRRERGYRVGDALAKAADGMRVTHVVPFSSMHRYQREDSIWANEFTVSDTDYKEGFRSRRAELMPPFIRYDAATDEWSELRPSPAQLQVFAARDFGDDWSEELEPAEAAEVEAYLKRVEHLDGALGFVGFRVGGRDHVTRFRRGPIDTGVLFEVPRGSLLTSVRHQIFDDLLIGNFMRTRLVGRWPSDGLAGKFGRHLTRFADNGRAYSSLEVAHYLAQYRARQRPIDRVRTSLETGGARLFRSTFPVDSAPYRVVRRTYWAFRRLTA